MLPLRLVPFASDGAVSNLMLTGRIEREGSSLRAAYLLSGDLAAVVIPEPAERERRDGLWQATCFELFAARCDDARYLEVNLSPSGAWNAYSFTGYREGMAPLAVSHFASHCARSGPAGLELSFELRAEHAVLDARCDIALTAVIEHGDGQRSYWALAHTDERPNFHRRDSFILQR